MLKREGRLAGHSETTLMRAARRLQLHITSAGFPRRTYWSVTGSTSVTGAILNVLERETRHDAERMRFQRERSAATHASACNLQSRPTATPAAWMATDRSRRARRAYASARSTTVARIAGTCSAGIW